MINSKVKLIKKRNSELVFCHCTDEVLKRKLDSLIAYCDSTVQVQQSSGGERKYKGPLNCAKQLYTEKGMQSLYRGTCATLIRGESQLSDQIPYFKRKKACEQAL